MSTESFITVKDAASKLHVSKPTVQRYIQELNVPTSKIGTRLIIFPVSAMGALKELADKKLTAPRARKLPPSLHLKHLQNKQVKLAEAHLKTREVVSRLAAVETELNNLQVALAEEIARVKGLSNGQ